jgi:formylglycine-generating enzyme required for sulfatase activity
VSDIFLSYAREDRPRVKPVVDALAASGWSVWWDRTIIPGQIFERVIQTALDQAQCVVVLWSRHSVDSDWVQTEADEGQRRGVLIPALLDEVEIPLPFRRIQAANLVGWQGALPHAGFDELARGVEGILKTPAPRRTKGPAVAAPPAGAWPSEPVRRDVDREVLRPEQPAAPAAPEGWRNPRLRLIAGALLILAVGTAIFFIQAPKGRPPTQQPAVRVKSGSASRVRGSQLRALPPPAVQTRENLKDGLTYVWIPPGRFKMGCSPGDKECFDNEKPAHEVTITHGFWMGQTPVTQEAYQRVLGHNPSHFKGPRLPVEEVTWNEAQSYCEAVGMRLPTEAEWEYAARAGSATARYGNLDEVAWYIGNSDGQTHEVGQKQPNAFGLYDVLGNVFQWVADWYGQKYDEQKVAVNPTGPSSGQYRVLRGGAWAYNPRDARASYRYRSGPEPSNRNDNFGFRCAGELR